MLTICVIGGYVVAALWLAYNLREDAKADLSGLSWEQLQSAMVWEALGGECPNDYSREMERRMRVDALGRPL